MNKTRVEVSVHYRGEPVETRIRFREDGTSYAWADIGDLTIFIQSPNDATMLAAAFEQVAIRLRERSRLLGGVAA